MLGKRIATLRQKAGLSQAKLAWRIHVSPSAMGMYEQGRRTPPISILIALADEFGVSVDFLLSGSPLSFQDLSVMNTCFPDELPGNNDLCDQLAQANTHPMAGALQFIVQYSGRIL